MERRPFSGGAIGLIPTSLPGRQLRAVFVIFFFLANKSFLQPPHDARVRIFKQHAYCLIIRDNVYMYVPTAARLLPTPRQVRVPYAGHLVVAHENQRLVRLVVSFTSDVTYMPSKYNVVRADRDSFLASGARARVSREERAPCWLYPAQVSKLPPRLSDPHKRCILHFALLSRVLSFIIRRQEWFEELALLCGMTLAGNVNVACTYPRIICV